MVRNYKYFTKLIEVPSLNCTDLKFKKMVYNEGVLKAQSVVTVPMTRHTCGAPTNLKITKIRKKYYEKILLSWNAPNAGSCQITSYTVFWCYFNKRRHGCEDNVSNCTICYIIGIKYSTI